MSKPDLVTLENMFSHINPNSLSRNEWLNLGAAVKREYGASGQHVWLEMSARYNAKDPREVSPMALQAQWKSIDINKTNHSIGTIVYYAQKGGWVRDANYQEMSSISKIHLDAGLQAEKMRDEQFMLSERQQILERTSIQFHKYGKQIETLDHPYLVAKGITSKEAVKTIKEITMGTNDPRKVLMIPIYKEGSLSSVQYISEAKNEYGDTYFQKNYRGGLVKQGGFLALNPKADKEQTFLVEGFATGASILEARPDANVVIAFDSHNLKPVAHELLSNKQIKELIICADNDFLQSVNKYREIHKDNPEKQQPTLGELNKYNPGVSTAHQIKESDTLGRVKVILPPLTRDELLSGLTDFNDAHKIRGLAKLRETLNQAVPKLLKPQTSHNVQDFMINTDEAISYIFEPMQPNKTVALHQGQEQKQTVRQR